MNRYTYRSAPLAEFKPHILKAKGGNWHVAAMSTVPRHLVKAAVEYRDNFLERDKTQRLIKGDSQS